jgi:hypothetical protein
MKKLLLLLLFFVFTLNGCSQTSYKDITSSIADIQLYNLKQINLTDDNGTKITLHIPNDLKENANTVSEKNPTISVLSSFNGIDEGFSVAIDKFYSRNTEKILNKKYIEIMEDGFKNEMGGDFNVIKKALPPSLEDVKIVSLDFDLMIDGKFFARRVLYCKDTYYRGTYIYDTQITEYQYVTLHNKRKYTFTIRSHSDIQNHSSLIALMNTIAGSIKFQ